MSVSYIIPNYKKKHWMKLFCIVHPSLGRSLPRFASETALHLLAAINRPPTARATTCLSSPCDGIKVSIVSVLGQDEGYTVKYNPSHKGGRRALFDCIYRVESLYKQYIIFRNIQDKFLYCPSMLANIERVDSQYSPCWEGNISSYTPLGKYWMFCVL